MSEPTVLTLTVNPAIDRTIIVDRLVFEDRTYILSRTDAAGGRGLNAARVLTSFHASAIAIMTSGKDGGRRLEELLKQDTFTTDVVRIRSDIRTNFTISDRQGLSLKLNELGPSLSHAELARIRKTVEKHLPQVAWLMICGSVPPGVDVHFYTKLIRLAAKHNVKTLLDTDGDALLHGIEAAPTVVTPNQSEAERLLNRALITRSHGIEAARQMKGMGPEHVVLSLGSRGAVAASPTGVFEVVPPRIEAVCPIGAGDALAAVVVWALSKGYSFPEAVKWGVAAGTASAKLPGIQMASFEQANEVFARTQVTKVA